MNLTDEQLIAKIDAISAEFVKRRKALYDKCAEISTDILKEKGFDLKVFCKAEFTTWKIYLQINGRDIPFLIVFHGEESFKTYPVYLGTGDDGWSCKDEKALRSRLKKYFGCRAIRKIIREEMENKRVVGSADGKPVYSHELPRK